MEELAKESRGFYEKLLILETIEELNSLKLIAQNLRSFRRMLKFRKYD
jgi:hypothetical protein